MRFFLDTANLDEIRKVKEYGLLDGVTTNPTLLAREGGDWKKQAQEICKIVEGPVSLEVIGETADEMIKEAHELVKYGPNVVIKIPMTLEGMKAVQTLSKLGIETNVTVVFSPSQALLAAKSGATYVSPFIGRLDGLSQNGMTLVEQIVQIFDNYGYETNVLVASVRNPMHVVDSALIGADVITLPFKVIEELSKHPMTDKGIESFNKDWERVFGK